MITVRRAGMVAQVLVFVVAVTGWGIQVLPAEAETIGTPQAATGTAVLGGVACPASSFCEAVGVGTGSNENAVVPVNSGTPGTAVTFTDGALFQDVACPSTTTCLGVTGNFPPGGQVVVINSGTPSAPQGVSGTQFLLGIACPTATTCEGVGDGDPGGGVVVPVVNGVPGSPTPVPSVTFELNGIACPTSTMCYAVGLDTGGTGVVVPITNGTPGVAVTVPGTGTLEGIACPTATTCEAVGQDFSGPNGVVVSITNGVPGAAQSIAGTENLVRVACPTATVCEAVGGTPGIAGALVRIDNGTPGTVQTVAATSGLRDIACPTSTTCEAVGVAGLETAAQVGVVVTITLPVTPTLTTAASSSVPVGGRIRDSANLAGGTSPSGMITFTLFGPGDTTCTTSIATSTATVSGDGTFSSADAIPDTPGTYQWVASYGGDSFNDPVSTPCGDPREQVAVTPQTLTGRAYGVAATGVSPRGRIDVLPTPDTGAVSTTSAGTTSTPCVVTLTGVLAAHGLCANVTTALRPSRSSAKASVLDLTIGVPGIPTISVTGLKVTSQISCAGSSGATTFAGLTIGGHRYPSDAPPPGTTISLPGLVGAQLVVNEQKPVSGGLMVNGLHLRVATGGYGVDLVVASATSDIHNCP